MWLKTGTANMKGAGPEDESVLSLQQRGNISGETLQDLGVVDDRADVGRVHECIVLGAGRKPAFGSIPFCL